jgi:hypothetical protein
MFGGHTFTSDKLTFPDLNQLKLCGTVDQNANFPSCSLHFIYHSYSLPRGSSSKRPELFFSREFALLKRKNKKRLILDLDSAEDPAYGNQAVTICKPRGCIFKIYKKDSV